MAQNNSQADTEPNANGGTNAQDGGNDPKTYTQEELDSIVSERTGRATKAALKSFFSQKGLSEDEATQAINEYLEAKKKSTPDPVALQSAVNDERKARIKSQLRAAGTLEAVKQGVSVNSIDYVLRLASLDDCVDNDGNVAGDKLSEAIKKVLDTVPAFKAETESNGGVHRVGGDGGNGEKQTADDALRRAFGLKPKGA
jgi:predicted HicB family RNase H-like nuclease